jgi:tRNA 2-selenouridine synthase
MAETLISLDDFFRLRKEIPILDARSESEFVQSHIPQAVNLPILNNRERVLVGTLYKEQGAEAATLKGFELVGPRFHQIQKEAIRLFPDRKILIYCWRGGMRSQILSWLLQMVGFEVFRLKGGYKAYRTFTFEEVRKDRMFIVLGGKTGTGKTVLLQNLKERGEQILDLEGVANHKGSSFGAIGQLPQPSVEQFENLLSENLMLLDPKKPVWIENESRKIGRLIIPDKLFDQMSQNPLLAIKKSEKERIQQIAQEYAYLPESDLIAAVKRLSKRLGGLRTTQAIEAIISQDHESWISNLLGYYDKTYEFDLTKHQESKIIQVDLEGMPVEDQIHTLLHLKYQLYGNAKDQTY